MEQFEELKKELESEVVENNKTIDLCHKRLKNIYLNSLDFKVTLGITLMSFIYFIIHLVGVIIFKNLEFPFLSYKILAIASSLGLSILFEEAIIKDTKVEEEYQKFSKASTNLEKLEEELDYQIELEEACNRNKVIKETLDIINSTESMVNELSSKYNISEKHSARSKEELEKSIEEISNLIKEKYIELDVISTKKVLHDKFWKIRSKFDKNANLITYSLIAGTFAMVGFGYPFAAFNSFTAGSTVLTNALSVFGPLAIGSIVTFVYFIKRNKDYEQVFKEYNSQLKDEALSDTLGKNDDANDECYKIKCIIEKQVKDIATAIIKLNDEKVSLAAKSKEKTWDDLLYTETEMREYADNLKFSIPVDYNAILGIDESSTKETDSSHAQTSGPVLSRKLDIGKKNN